MSAEHGRALYELRAFREQVTTFQRLISGFPSDARPPVAPGVMPPPSTNSRKALEDALDTLLGRIGIYEVLLQSGVG
jgi:hypothetical protein